MIHMPSYTNTCIIIIIRMNARYTWLHEPRILTFLLFFCHCRQYHSRLCQRLCIYLYYRYIFHSIPSDLAVSPLTHTVDLHNHTHTHTWSRMRKKGRRHPRNPRGGDRERGRRGNRPGQQSESITTSNKWWRLNWYITQFHSEIH